MKGRNYIQNKKSLSDSEMDKFKDFDGVMNKLDGGPEGQADNGNSMNAFSGVGKGALLFLGAVALIWFAIIKLKPNKEVAGEETVAKADTTIVNSAKYEVNPPFEGIDVAYEEFIVDAEKDVELFTKNKSIISIKKNSFKDMNGNAVQGDVTIRFREFHRPLEIFKAGIPMEYDSAGTTYTFESAGMFEIRAMQNGKMLQNDLEKEIVVDLVSKNDGEQFNKYVFDEKKGAWDYKSKCAIVKEEEIDQLAGQKDNKEKALPETKGVIFTKDLTIKEVKEPEVPKFPKLISTKYAFTIDYDKKEFPELGEGVVFQVDEARSKFSSIYYDLNWDKVDMKRSKVQGNYTITLQKGDKVLNIESFPAFSEAEYRKRKAQYDIDLAKYKNYIASIARAQANYSRVGKTEQKVIRALNKFAVPANFRGRRSFRVNRMGYWNSDHPVQTSAKNGRKVLAYFNDGENDVIVKRTYNVVGRSNILYSAQIDNSVTYKPNSRNIMWAITEDNKLAITKSADFEKISDAEHVFEADIYSANKGLRVLEDLF